MAPQTDVVSYSSAGNGRQPRRRPRAIIIVVAVIFLIIVGFVYYERTVFRIVSTAPLVKKITTQTSSLAIRFSQPISSNNFSATSTPSIITKHTIDGNILTLAIARDTLLSSKTYTVNIKSISDVAGKELFNQKLTFTPIHIAPAFIGEKGLYGIGLSNSQVGDLNTYFSRFKPWASRVTIDQSTIKHYRASFDDAWSPWDVSFTVKINGISYNAVTSYTGTETILLDISDSTSNLRLFTAGNAGSF